MSTPSASNEYTRLQKAGILVFVLLCGFPALELNGFGVGIPLTLRAALICATIGGAASGIMVCSRPFLAGLAGGLLAGPLSLYAVYYYTQHRESVLNYEIVLVQGLACLPGIGIGWLMKMALSGDSPNTL